MSTGMGRTYSFDVEPSTTIQQLKQLFREKTDKDDVEKMCFYFDEEYLDEDDKTLWYYDIEEDSVLELIDIRANGRNIGSLGMKFVDVSNSGGLKRREWSTKAPRWRRTRCGLCLEGKCTNPGCEAHNQMVIIRIGYKKFDLINDTSETTTVCPICNRYVEPITCAFNNCWWRYEGKRKERENDGEPPKKYSSDWKQADNAYHYFDKDTTGTVIWRQLIFEVVKKKPQK